MQDLKDLAVDRHVPVLALVALEKPATSMAGRLRPSDMRGPAALGYEADVVLLMHEKYEVVAHDAPDPGDRCVALP